MVKLMAEAQQTGMPSTYKDLMASVGIGGLSNDDALNHIGHLIDACQKPRHATGIERALQWSDELEARGLYPVQLTILEYFRSNAWDHKRLRSRKGKATWSWNSPPCRSKS